MSDVEPSATAGRAYTDRLRRLEGARWKQLLDVQAPYRWNMRRLQLGYTLDVGCGIGRNLAHLSGHGVGVDHNAESVGVARSRGFTAYTVGEFFALETLRHETFDSILIAHVIEHMSFDAGLAMVKEYLPYLRRHGRVCFITPQEAGYRSDDTHVRFVDFHALAELAQEFGLTVQRRYSFPLPRAFGKLFRYNEFVLIVTRPSTNSEIA